MKYFLLLLAICSIITAQNSYDNNGKKHGTWYGYYDTGEVRYKGAFEHGNPSGAFVYYYDDASIKSSSTFSHNGDTMAAVLYHKYPIVAAEGKYARAIKKRPDGTIDSVYEKQGTWKFYDARGKIASQENFKDDQLDGANYVYYLTGEVSRACNYRNGVLHGAYVEYFKDGQIKEEGTKVDGNYDGFVKHYYPNGRTMQQGKYRAGVKHGIWIVFNTDGTTEGKYYYNLGRLLENEIEINKFKETLDSERQEQ